MTLPKPSPLSKKPATPPIPTAPSEPRPPPQLHRAIPQPDNIREGGYPSQSIEGHICLEQYCWCKMHGYLQSRKRAQCGRPNPVGAVGGGADVGRNKDHGSVQKRKKRSDAGKTRGPQWDGSVPMGGYGGKKTPKKPSGAGHKRRTGGPGGSCSGPNGGHGGHGGPKGPRGGGSGGIAI